MKELTTNLLYSYFLGKSRVTYFWMVTIMAGALKLSSI